MTQHVRAQVAIVVAVAGMVFAAGCAPSKPITDERLWTDDYEIRVSVDPMPPRAGDAANFTVYIRDKKTREPIVNGQGRIFATNSDKHSIYNGFTYGPEVGTYHTHLLFVTAGEWALGVQFRRDSTLALQQSLDWRQSVRGGTPLGATPGK